MKIPKKKLFLPKLPYELDGLEPITSKKALEVHYRGHHEGYVNNFNRMLAEGGSKEDLEFNFSGHILHSKFWESYSPIPTTPGTETIRLLSESFTDRYPAEAFINYLVETAMKIKGAGWAVAVKHKNKLKIVSIANHDLRHIVNSDPLLLLDAWEHVYYLDYANKKKEFFEGIVNLVNWDVVENRILPNY